MSTFVFTTTVLRYIRSDQTVPDIAMVLTFGLGLAVLVAVLTFITHMVRMLRIDTMMRAVHDETDNVIEMFYPRYEQDPHRRAEELPSEAGEVVDIRADGSGFVTAIDVKGLLAAARRLNVMIALEVRAGDHVVRGTPIASACSLTGGPVEARAVEAVVRQAVRLGYERTMDQDAAYGFRQLADIAVKALSPSINDPVIAVHAVGHMSDLLVTLSGRRLGGTLHEGADGVGRVVVPDRDFPYYLELACGQIRRYGAAEPTALVALLRMLRDVALAARDDALAARDDALAARDDAQRAQLVEQTELIVSGACPTLSAHDLTQVKHMAERVHQALHGDARAAYRDRAGETRSI